MTLHLKQLLGLGGPPGKVLKFQLWWFENFWNLSHLDKIFDEKIQISNFLTCESRRGKYSTTQFIFISSFVICYITTETTESIKNPLFSSRWFYWISQLISRTFSRRYCCCNKWWLFCCCGSRWLFPRAIDAACFNS